MSVETGRPPLLATKLFIPPLRSNMVARARLLNRLDNGRFHPLILVTAPAGFGKTTLINCWLTRRQKRVAWVSLDKTDNVPIIFISYIVEALQQISGSACGTISSLLKSHEPPSIDILLSYLINDMSCLKEPVILTLDDYHVIETEEVHQALDFIIDNAPPTLQIIIISRQTLPLAVSRLRAQNQLIEITAVDLRFTHDEIVRFFNDVMQIPLSAEAVARLEERTEGWVVGLQLAALGLKEQTNSDAYIHSFTGDSRFVADYLVDEALTYQPIAIERFLLQTSILSQFNASLCNAVLGIDNAQELLMQMEKANLFLIPLDNKREWYRYHHLFGEMLYGRLRTHAPEILFQLYQKTVTWHLSNGMLQEAIEYALTGQDYDQAVLLIKRALFEIKESNRRHLIIQWVEWLPFTIVKENRILWAEYTIVQFFYGNFDKALTFLRRLGYLPSEDRSSGELSIDQAYAYPLLASITLHTTINATAARDLNQQALAFLPEDTHLLKGIAIGHKGTANFLLGDMVAAKTDLMEAIQLIEKAMSWSTAIVFKGYLARVIARQGQLTQAARIYRELQEFALHQEFYHSASLAFSLINYGLIFYEWNDLVEAEVLISAGERQARSSGEVDQLLQVVQALVKTSKITDDVFDITEKLSQIELLAQKYGNPPLVISRLDALHAFSALKRGELAQPVQWAKDFKQTHQEIAVLQQFEWMTVARIWLAVGKETESITLLQSLQTLAQNDGRNRDLMEISVWLVSAYHQSGEEAQALQELSSLLLAAEPEGYVRTFVDAGDPLRQLMVKLLAENGRFSPQTASPTYIRHILNAFPESPQPTIQPIAETLTSRELEVLQLLATGMTYAQIANALTITNNTLKTHIKRIYSKLNVHNRVQAVLVANQRESL